MAKLSEDRSAETGGHSIDANINNCIRKLVFKMKNISLKTYVFFFLLSTLQTVP